MNLIAGHNYWGVRFFSRRVIDFGALPTLFGLPRRVTIIRIMTVFLAVERG